MGFQTSIAYQPSSDKIKHVSEVPNGLACGCFCQEENCKGALEAVQSPEYKRKWYFRHSNKTNCQGGFESLLHKYAKQIITESNSIIRLENERINYSHSISEMSIDPYRPDVTLTISDNEKVYIEVFVSNKVKEIKRDFFISNKFKSFEIDLSDFADKNNLIDTDEIRKKVLDDFTNRKSLYWPNENNLVCNIVLGVIAFFGLRYISKKLFK